MKRIGYWMIGLSLCGLSTFAAADEADRLAALETRLNQLEQRGGQGVPLYASWQNGIRLNSADNDIHIRIGGRVQGDFAGFDADSSLPDFDSGTTFRRTRLYVGGSLYDRTIFNVEYDFAGGDATLLTTFIGIRRIPFLGTIRVGRLLEFYSLEQLSSNNFHTFMERGLSAAFNQYWNNGIGIHNSMFDGRGTWAVGAAKSTNPYGRSDADSQHTFSTRLTAAPIYQDDGRTWLHLGLSGIQRKPDGDEYRVRSRPESSVAPFLVDTDVLAADRVNQVGLELAATHGPVSVQAEWHQARVRLLATEDHDGQTSSLSGFYVYVSWFLTGEHRPYNRQNGTFGRVTPRSSLGGDGHGWGAWELAARYAELDLNDGPVKGGHLRNATLGLNWYLNPNVRLMGNLIRADLKEEGHAHIAQMRLAFDF